MQVHLDAPQADLNAWGTREQQDLYQSHFESEKHFNIMICIDICELSPQLCHARSSGFPNMFDVYVRLSEKSYSLC